LLQLAQLAVLILAACTEVPVKTVGQIDRSLEKTCAN
jgi:hypothetical protein